MAKKQKAFCIICGKEKGGIEVRNDRVLGGIRWIKQNITHNESGNRLVVCKECYEAYKKSKKRFESRKKVYLILGIIFAALLMVIGRSAISLLFGVFMILLLYSFAFFSYMPELALGPGQNGRASLSQRRHIYKTK